MSFVEASYPACPWPSLCCVCAGAAPVSGAADAFFFHIAARRAKRMAAASKTVPVSAPITIPAMAPPESLEPESEEDESDPEAAQADVGIEEASPDAGLDDAVAAAFELVGNVTIVELPAAELAMLDSVTPRTCASRTTPTFDV